MTSEDFDVAEARLIAAARKALWPEQSLRAQGFPGDYRIDIDFEGKPLTKTAQIELAGNSVCPDAAEALVRENALPARRRVA